MKISFLSSRTIRLIVISIVLLMIFIPSLAIDYSYKSYAEIIDEINMLSINFPTIAQTVPLSPDTLEGHTIYALKISDNVTSSETEQRVLIVGNHHAREWISTEVPLHLANDLVTNYDTNLQIRSMVNNLEIWIIPVLNPDGYEYSRQNPLTRLWRKNRRHVNFACSLHPNGRGVDLNRNYGATTWGTIDDPFTSSNCTSNTYRGPTPFSERETQAVRNLMTTYEFNAVLSYHSYSQLILYPWGHTDDPIGNNADNYLMSSMAYEMSSLINHIAGAGSYIPQQSSELYRTAGDFTDWTYETFSIPSFTIELPPSSSSSSVGFRLPVSEIEPTWSENRPAAHFLIDFFNLKIVESEEIFAGPANEPNKIRVVVSGVWRGKNRDDFLVNVGNQNANIISITRLPEQTTGVAQNGYELLIQAPTQPSNGRYDLGIIVDDATARQENAVLYADQSNVDVILVIDRSGSMTGQKINDAKNAALQFIDLMNDGDQLGIVSFSSNATTNFELTTLSETTRQTAMSAVNAISTGGNTSIGAGLLHAADQMVLRGNPDHTSAIVILSNGGENVAPFVSEILPGIKTKGITVHTVALGISANEALMQEIASQTGGTFHSAPSSSDLSEVYNHISTTIGNQFTLLSKESSVLQGGSGVTQVAIDSSVEEATFSIAWGGSDLDLVLTTPSGSIIDPTVASNNTDIEFTSSSTFELYRIKSPESGEWIMNTHGVVVDYPAGEPYRSTVSARTSLFIDLFLETGAVSGQPITVSTRLSDDQPILEAQVNVVIESPSATTTLTLFDDGAHNDGLANDGLYANQYTSNNLPGSYTFTAISSGISNAGSLFTRQVSESIVVFEQPTQTARVLPHNNMTVVPGATYVLTFEIQNVGLQPETYSLIAGPGEEDVWANLGSVPEEVTIAPGGAIQVPITINVPPPEDGPQNNIVTLVAVSQSDLSVRDQGSVILTVPSADLYVNLTGPSESTGGLPLTYTIDYGNLGSAEALNVIIGLEYPPEMEYISDTFTNSIQLSQLSRGWILTSIPPSTQESFTVDLQATSIGQDTTVSLTVAIVSGYVGLGDVAQTPDPHFNNNSGTLDTLLQVAFRTQVDIKPGSVPNSINCMDMSQVIPVAILTTDEFDATQVDHSTVQFEGGSEIHTRGRNHQLVRHEEDVDEDGDVDLVFHFEMEDTNLGCGSTEGTLTGETFDGVQIIGTDSIVSRPINSPPNARNDNVRYRSEDSIIIDVLANDSDPDGDEITLVDVAPALNGTTEMNADGTVTYTPNDGFEGVEVFSYTITDGNNMALGSVTVRVK